MEVWQSHTPPPLFNRHLKGVTPQHIHATTLHICCTIHHFTIFHSTSAPNSLSLQAKHSSISLSPWKSRPSSLSSIKRENHLYHSTHHSPSSFSSSAQPLSTSGDSEPSRPDEKAIAEAYGSKERSRALALLPLLGCW